MERKWSCFSLRNLALLSISCAPLILCVISREAQLGGTVFDDSYELSVSSRRGQPFQCFSDNECPSAQYCELNEYSDKFRKCEPLVGENERCKNYDDPRSTDASNCKDGLRCATAKGKKDVCMLYLRKGEKCDPEDIYACVDGTFCSKKTKRCVAEGVLGDACGPFSFQDSCSKSMGLYCKYENQNSESGTCQRKKPDGRACDGDDECHGFCTSNNVQEFRKPFCMSLREMGQMCSEHSHCGGDLRPGRKLRQSICNWENKYTGSLPRFGVCALEKNLIKTVGQRCTPEMDLCDYRRDLACEKREENFVCVQKGGVMIWAHAQCTPGSRYSSCPRQECRRFTKRISKRPYGAYFCVEPAVVLQRGQICSEHEYARCERGTECVKAPGVRNMHKDEPLGYCMKRVGGGSDCSYQFRTACARGLFCIQGKCGTGAKPRNSAMFSGHDAYCAKRPCAPGLVCQNKRCSFPTTTVELGAACGNTPTTIKVCEGNAVCDDWAKRREERCERRSESGAVVGEECDDISPCVKGLKCSNLLRLEPYTADRVRICYNASTSLTQGTACSRDEADDTPMSRYPRVGYPLPECFFPKKGVRFTKCLRKKDGLACQVEAKLFEYCSEKENIACEKGLVCGKMSVCVGPNDK